jgi:sugar-specific transcriptional regulator TrmB
MDSLSNFLVDLGLGKNEVEIFIDLTKSGTSSVLEISRRTKINRSNIYDTISHLISRGLVYEIDKEKKMYSARPLADLKIYLQIKNSELNKILQEYQHFERRAEEKIKLTKGRFAVRRALFSLLETGEDIIAWGIPKEATEIIGPILSDFHKERIQRGITMRHIYNSDSIERARFISKHKFTEARILPPKYNSKSSTNISGNKVVLIIWEGELTVIEITDESLARPYKEYFNLLYSKSKVV